VSATSATHHPRDETGTPDGASPPGPRRYRLVVRSRDDRVLTGTAAGLAEALGIEPLLVRLSFAVLTVAGGTGIVLYLVLWVLSAEPDTITLNPAIRERPRTRQIAAVACIVAGCMLVGRSTGLTFGAAFAWPVALAAAGSALIGRAATRATGSAGLASASACPATRWRASSGAGSHRSGWPGAAC